MEQRSARLVASQSPQIALARALLRGPRRHLRFTSQQHDWMQHASVACYDATASFHCLKPRHAENQPLFPSGFEIDMHVGALALTFTTEHYAFAKTRMAHALTNA